MRLQSRHHRWHGWLSLPSCPIRPILSSIPHTLPNVICCQLMLRGYAITVPVRPIDILSCYQLPPLMSLFSSPHHHSPLHPCVPIPSSSELVPVDPPCKQGCGWGRCWVDPCCGFTVMVSRTTASSHYPPYDRVACSRVYGVGARGAIWVLCLIIAQS